MPSNSGFESTTITEKGVPALWASRMACSTIELEAYVRITSPGSILLAARSRISLSAAVTRSRMKMSISSSKSRFASASGVDGSILIMISFNHRMAFPMLILRGLQLLRYSIWGLRWWFVRWRAKLVPGGV